MHATDLETTIRPTHPVDTDHRGRPPQCRKCRPRRPATYVAFWRLLGNAHRPYKHLDLCTTHAIEWVREHVPSSDWDDLPHEIRPDGPYTP